MQDSTGIRMRLEAMFTAYGTLVCRYRYLAVLLILAMAIAMASGLRHISIDTSTESFLHPDDEVLVRYEEYRDQFGRDDIIVIAIQPGEVFAGEALSRLGELHDTLDQRVPHVAAITSLINIRETRGEGDRLIVADLLESWPGTEEEFSDLRDRVLASPLYRNRLVSPDGRFTTIVIELDYYSGQDGVSVEDALSLFDEPAEDPPEQARLTEAETTEALLAAERVVSEFRTDDFSIEIAGTPVVMDALKLSMQEDMRTFIVLVVAAIVALLLAVFRFAAAVMLPLATVVLALLSTVGMMGHLGTTIKLPTIILPSFLLAVGIGAAIHLLEIWRQNRTAGESNNQAIANSLGHAGLPIMLTSLTTAAGLGSFSFAEVAPIAELGRYSAFGVIIALLYMLVLLPAGLAILPDIMLGGNHERRTGRDRIGAILAHIASWSIRNATMVCVTSALIVMSSIWLASQLRFSHDVLSWLPADSQARLATTSIDRNMGGTVALEVVVNTGTENGLHDRETLVRLDQMARELESLESGPVIVGSTWSIAGLVKEIHQALNENRADFYRIPENERLIPQEFLLFENSGSDDLEDMVDTKYSMARFSMRVPWVDTLAYTPFIGHVENRFLETFAGASDITFTGIMSIMSRTLDAAIHSTAQSYTIAFVVITVMMILLIGQFVTGLISMIPNLMPIVITLAMMYVTGIPLNLFTMLVGSIAIGLAVDDTVHFMHHFHRYLHRTGNLEDAVRRTMQTSGRAMLTTSLILSTGFFIFCFSAMSNLFQFGLLTGITILLALAADFVLAPAVMALRYRHQPIDGSIQKGDAT